MKLNFKENTMRVDDIQGENVYLTPITYNDCEDFIRWRNSDFIKSRFIYQKDITLEEQYAWIKEKVETGLVAQYIIFDRKNDKKIGCVYLRDIDKINKAAEFGILIGEKDYIGKGYGTESARLMVRHGFIELGLERIYLRVLRDNYSAIKSYEKVGFKLDTTEKLQSGGEIVFMSIQCQ